MSSNFCLTQNAKLLCQEIHYYHSHPQGAQQAPHCRHYLIHKMLLVSRKLACGKKEEKNTKLSIYASCSQEFWRHIIKAPGLDCQSAKW